MDMQWKEITALQRVSPLIPPGTRLHVGFLDSEDLAMRVETARAITRCGFVAIPIIAARRLESERMLRDYLTALRAAGGFGSVMVVGGDPAQPRGPYPDAGSVIGSGILEEHGVREVSLAGHPGGNPAVADAGVLWRALAGKVTALSGAGCAALLSRSSGSTRPRSWRGSLTCGRGVPACRSGSRSLTPRAMPRPTGSSGTCGWL